MPAIGEDGRCAPSALCLTHFGDICATRLWQSCSAREAHALWTCQTASSNCRCTPRPRSVIMCKEILNAELLCRYELGKKEGKYNEEEAKRERAKQSLERYMHYFQRFAENDKARKQASTISRTVELHALLSTRLQRAAVWVPAPRAMGWEICLVAVNPAPSCPHASQSLGMFQSCICKSRLLSTANLTTTHAGDPEDEGLCGRQDRETERAHGDANQPAQDGARRLGAGGSLSHVNRDFLSPSSGLPCCIKSPQCALLYCPNTSCICAGLIIGLSNCR